MPKVVMHLTEDELEAIKSLVERGVQLLENMGYPEDIDYRAVAKWETAYEQAMISVGRG